jgi:surfactin synthase thioesterase subunit
MSVWFDSVTARLHNGHRAEVLLFCFAHAGGGAAFYRPWQTVLGPDIEVCPVVLPGREARRRELPYTRMGELVEPLFDALLSRADRPFALFGHSMGAAVAYEMACRFSVVSVGGPRCLIVSGRQPPHRPARHPPIHRLPQDEFVARVARLDGTPAEVLRDKELLAAFLPGLRADFELNETYAPAPHPRLVIPVFAFVGDTDPLVEPPDMLAWGEVTTGPFDTRVFSGGHFYVQGARPEVLVAVREAVSR